MPFLTPIRTDTDVHCVTGATPPADTGVVNYELLLRRLEQVVIFQPNAAKARQYLSSRQIWQRLNPEQRHRWRQLALVAGLPAVAREIDATLTADNSPPESVAAPPSDARSEQTDPPHSAASESHPAGGAEAPAPTSQAAAPSEPSPSLSADFDHLRRQEHDVQRYLTLFQGREDCFARQWVDREAGTQGYVPVRRALQPQDVRDHLNGRKTYGIYLLQANSHTRLGVIDADLAPSLRKPGLKAEAQRQVLRQRDYLLARLPEISREMELPCLTELSGGKGYHFWYFFETPLPAAGVRLALNRIVKQISADITAFELEVFPKQDLLAGKGLGNLVKLPLGIHRVTGRKSFFMHVASKEPAAQLEGLQAACRIPATALQPAAAPTAPVVTHPRHQAWADAWPELALLRERCVALGSLITACQQQRDLSAREEKILLGTLGFLPRAKSLLHHLLQRLPEYNPHLVDYKLSRLRGTPLGCRRIHSLLALTQDMCPFDAGAEYAHPLRHCPQWQPDAPPAETITNLNDALEGLQQAISVVQRFMPRKG